MTSRRRALGAGIGLAVVVATYGASGLGDSSRWWAAAATVLVAVALADLLPTVRELLPIPGVAPLTLVAALGAIYLCVPETDQIPVAAIVPVVVVVLELVGRRQVGLEWYAVAAASVLWAGMFGAAGRQSALIGALFAWWAVVLLPLVNGLRRLPSGRVGNDDCGDHCRDRRGVGGGDGENGWDRSDRWGRVARRSHVGGRVADRLARRGAIRSRAQQFGAAPRLRCVTVA